MLDVSRQILSSLPIVFGILSDLSKPSYCQREGPGSRRGGGLVYGHWRVEGGRWKIPGTYKFCYFPDFQTIVLVGDFCTVLSVILFSFYTDHLCGEIF